MLDADPLRVEQALGNLVDNALAYGGGSVTLAARPRDGVVELHVTDNGAGFPEGFVERAFDRFSRADDARSRGGTGLGLVDRGSDRACARLRRRRVQPSRRRGGRLVRGARGVGRAGGTSDVSSPGD